MATAKKAAAKKAKKVKVTARARLSENEGTFEKGETFETTPKRAKALGELVKPASD